MSKWFYFSIFSFSIFVCSNAMEYTGEEAPLLSPVVGEEIGEEKSQPQYHALEDAILDDLRVRASAASMPFVDAIAIIQELECRILALKERAERIPLSNFYMGFLEGLKTLGGYVRKSNFLFYLWVARNELRLYRRALVGIDESGKDGVQREEDDEFETVRNCWCCAKRKRRDHYEEALKYFRECGSSPEARSELAQSVGYIVKAAIIFLNNLFEAAEGIRVKSILKPLLVSRTEAVGTSS